MVSALFGSERRRYAYSYTPRVAMPMRVIGFFSILVRSAWSHKYILNGKKKND